MKQIWHDLIKHGFESDVNGIDVVLRTVNHAHTYHVVNGEPIYVGPGELVDPDTFMQASSHINPKYFSNTTVEYHVDIYCTDEFMASFRTDNARTACIGAVLIMVGTSLLFFLYDCKSPLIHFMPTS